MVYLSWRDGPEKETRYELSRQVRPGGISFMWFIKSELRKQVDKYDKDKEILAEFARYVRKPRIEDITLDDVKAFYTAIVAPKNSQWERNRCMLAVRKFFKYYRGENVLKWQSVTDDPLKCVDNIDMINNMPKEIVKDRGPGRPRDIASIKKVVAFRKEGITFREIAKVLKKDVSQVYVWWDKHEELLS